MFLSKLNFVPNKNILFFLQTFGHFGIFLIEIPLIVTSVVFWQQSKNLAMIVLPLLLATLSYDNLILSIGTFIGEGGLLESLSMMRFLLHYIVVPFFIVVGVEIAHRAKASWANQPVRVLSWVIALVLAGMDIKTNYIGLELVPEYFAGSLRYVTAVRKTPIITIVVNLFMVGIGIGTWVRLKWPWLFVGSLFSLLGNALPSAMVGTLPASISELVIALSLLYTEQKVQPVSPENDSPQKQLEWEHIISKDGYTIYQSGEHQQGDFVQVFVPDSPYYDEHGKVRLITYLHGFALCLPQFYEAHLEALVKQGYYVVFPDFQHSDYPDTLNPSQQEEQHRGLFYWIKTLIDIIFKGKKFNPEADAPSNEKKSKLNKVRFLARKVLKPTLFKYLRVSIAVVVFILIVRLIFSWFNRRYGKNLEKLIITVAWSLAHSPVEWVNQSIYITDKAWKKLSADNAKIAQSEFDFYVFGHSLGGLLALSWPLYIQENQQKLRPKQIIAADPAPSTEMGMPRLAIGILKLLNSPFSAEPINIRQIGSKLTVPIGILHGVDDTIVKPESWVKPPLWQKNSNFDCIASQEKKIYFSLSDKQYHPPLIAFHNQAVTDTTYFDDALFNNFGGVKKSPNVYNIQYIWQAVDLVVKNKANVNQLLDKFNVPGSPLKVLDILPNKPIDFVRIAVSILTGLILTGLGYFAYLLWQNHTLV